MGIDLKALDRKIQRLQKFRELVAEFQNDPEFADIIAEFITPNGKKAVMIEAKAESTPNTDRQHRGYFIGAVSQAIASLEGEFTSSDLEKILRKRDVRINPNNANVAINDVLATLEKRDYVERAGKRGVSVLWKRKGSAVESRTA